MIGGVGFFLGHELTMLNEVVSLPPGSPDVGSQMKGRSSCSMLSNKQSIHADSRDPLAACYEVRQCSTFLSRRQTWFYLAD
jgi:hypothetical protein